jgi:hypothetical protein
LSANSESIARISQLGPARFSHGSRLLPASHALHGHATSPPTPPPARPPSAGKSVTMGFVDVAASYLFFTVIHTCLFALSLTACGLYGTDLQRANEANKYADSKWVSADATIHLKDLIG